MSNCSARSVVQATITVGPVHDTSALPITRAWHRGQFVLGNNGFDSPAVTDRDDQRTLHPDEVDMHCQSGPPAGRPLMGTLVMQAAMVANNDYRQHR